MIIHVIKFKLIKIKIILKDRSIISNRMKLEDNRTRVSLRNMNSAAFMKMIYYINSTTIRNFIICFWSSSANGGQSGNHV